MVIKEERITDKPSVNDYLVANNSIKYADYLAKNLDSLINYSDYIAENLDKIIDYSDYIAENLDVDDCSFSEYRIRKKYKNYISDNLDSSMSHFTKKLPVLGVFDIKEFKGEEKINQSINQIKESEKNWMLDYADLHSLNE